MRGNVPGLRRWLVILAAVTAGAPAAHGLTLSEIQPGTCQAVPLINGTPCFVDRPEALIAVPPALEGGTLIRTDASAWASGLSFASDQRVEVYICCDANAAAPSWLSSWVATDMVVPASQAVEYAVYAKRFPAGSVSLPGSDSGAAYFVVAQASEAIFPRNGWVLLSYDMPYLREVIRQAPIYHVNHIQLSHDLMMYVYEPLEQPTRRADLNELIDLAHAYGITDVTVWTHEFGTHGLPTACRAPDGRVDGDNPATWDWTRGRYTELFTDACPELDGVVVTFDEVSMMGEGCEVWDTDCFKFAGEGAGATRKVIQAVQDVCHAYGRTFYGRTWAGTHQVDIRDGILQTGDRSTWMMSKNVGGDRGYDWQYMDTHLAVIGTISGQGYNELIELDLCGEYLGRSQYTFGMAAYIKDHWNYAYDLGVRGGMVARIDRQGSLTWHTANRINLHAMDRILGERTADPAELNLEWCLGHFPADVAADIAAHYDAPGNAWDDTRLMTWEAFYPGLCTQLDAAQAVQIGWTALQRLARHRAGLEMQAVLDTRNQKSDYETLRNGIALSVLDLGGTLPPAAGFSNFRPALADSLAPDCAIDVRLDSPGLNPASAACEYSTNGGAAWNAWPAACSASSGSTAVATVTAAGVPFNQVSETMNLVRFGIADLAGVTADSGALRVSTTEPVVWSGFRPGVSVSTTPDVEVRVSSSGAAIDPATASYRYRTDGGLTWTGYEVDWDGRYECNVLPEQAGWAKVEGNLGSEAISVSDGLLCINDTSTASGSKVKFARNWIVDPRVGATAEARMQCTAGGHFFGANLQVSDALYGEALYLKANGMIGLYPSGLLVPAETAQWHTWRVTIQGTDINVYVDGDPRPVIRGQDTFVQSAAPPQQLLFGSGSSAGTQTIWYDYLYWTTRGAFAPAAWRAAGCTAAGPQATITAARVPFNQQGELNGIQFRIHDAAGRPFTSPVYTLSIRPASWADRDGDGDVDQSDFGAFQLCLCGADGYYPAGCEWADSDSDGDADNADVAHFLDCLAGSGRPPACQ